MTSPYLSKPARSMKTALDDRGMTAGDIGLDRSTLKANKMGRRGNHHYIAIAFACFVIALGVVSLSPTIKNNLNPEIMTAEEADILADEFSNIMPAAGN